MQPPKVQPFHKWPQKILRQACSRWLLSDLRLHCAQCTHAAANNSTKETTGGTSRLGNWSLVIELLWQLKAWKVYGQALHPLYNWSLCWFSRWQHLSSCIKQTCLPQILLSVLTLNSLCPYFLIFDRIFFFGGCTTNQSQQDSVKGQVFFHLLRTVCELTINTDVRQNWHTMNTWSPLFVSSVKVVLVQRLQNTFSKSNAPCVLLSLKQMCPFLNGCYLLRACFLGSELVSLVLAVFPLFVGFVQPLVTYSFEFKPAIAEDGYLLQAWPNWKTSTGHVG